MKLNSIFSKQTDTVLDSINNYQKALMEDINLKIRITYNQRTYTTHPIEWKNKTIIFESPMTGVDNVILPHNLPLNIIFVSKIALFYSKITISKSYSQENKLYYVAEITAPLLKKQQRESFRLDVLIDAQYDVMTYENNIPKVECSDFGTCVNISIGGMCLVSSKQLHAKDQLMISFTLAGVPLTFGGEVLFMGEKTEQGNFSHRIRFVDLDAADINQLNRLIFTIQRQQIKRP